MNEIRATQRSSTNTAPRVLVVEDEAALSLLLSYNLEAEGFIVERIERGDEAELKLEETPPDLVILDWMLPGVSGLEVCRRLRARDATRTLPVIMPYLHLPIQSGSDRVLAAMNRKHSAAYYLAIVDEVRAARPDIALSSDFIVGFPGESETDFEATLSLVAAVGYAGAFSFKYSSRPGTPGAERSDQVAEPCKEERLGRLQALIDEQRQAFNAGTVGRIVNVLAEKAGRHPGQIAGRTPYLQAIHFDGPTELIGEVVPVEIVATGPNSLSGRRVDERHSAGECPN